MPEKVDTVVMKTRAPYRASHGGSAITLNKGVTVHYPPVQAALLLRDSPGTFIIESGTEFIDPDLVKKVEADGVAYQERLDNPPGAEPAGDAAMSAADEGAPVAGAPPAPESAETEAAETEAAEEPDGGSADDAADEPEESGEPAEGAAEAPSRRATRDRRRKGDDKQ